MIRGEIFDTQDRPISGAYVTLTPTNQTTTTNINGEFLLENLTVQSYTITISHIGYKPITQEIKVDSSDLKLSFNLQEDPLNLESVVVTGNFDPRRTIQSSTTISILDSKTMQQVVPRGTANLLQQIPGTFVDASAGEVFTKVYSRGISASSEDDMGWYYLSLQEDGLPVSLSQHSYYGPDLFHRVDATTHRVEAVRGGNAAITALNGPGGIYNFISLPDRDDIGGILQLQGGIQGEGNPYSRVDATFGGKIGENWFFNVGGHYRVDDGARNTDFTFSKGGQLKFNITKKHSKGYLKFYGKILDDFTNRYTGVAATNWENPEAAFGQDFNTTALMMPSFTGNIPDGRRISRGISNKFDPSQGVHAQDRAFGINILQDLGQNWSLNFNLKHSHKNANWQTSISNAFVSLNDPLAYFISGAQFPIGQLVFREVASNTEIARLNNTGILAGEPFEYIGTGSLPNDGILGTAAWLKQIHADEWMNQTTIRKQTEKHDITFGLSGGLSKNSLFTQGSFGFATYESNPRMLEVTLENENQPTIALSDENGLSNYGGLFYDNADADIRQLALFINDKWKISNRINMDIGLRYESISHEGGKDRFAPLQQEGGSDGNPLTAYDNGLLTPTGVRDNFDFEYNYLSYSAALNYKLSNQGAVFLRYSKGNKAPELNYYFNNFTNVPINGKGEIQKIDQAELGLKYNAQDFSGTITGFWSQLANIGISDFAFDTDDNSIFYTPVQFNDSQTFGIEWESAYSPFTYVTFRFNGNLQVAKAKNWTVYDAAGSVDTSDDIILDFADNTLPFTPSTMFNLGASYQKDKLNGYLNWQFMGQREGNIANAFQLPSYSVFNLGLGYQINSRLSIDMTATNLFNSEGLANFFGANTFGANANGTTTDFIQTNPNASFVVVPILPRGTMFRVNYLF